MDQATELQNDELTPEELVALGESADVLDKEEPAVVEPAGAETTPALSKRGKAASASLSKWRQRIHKGRQLDIELLSQINTFKEQICSMSLSDRTPAYDLIHFAGEVLRAVNYWKESSQHIPPGPDMFRHCDEQREKPYDRQVYATLYMDSGCREILLNAKQVPLNAELRGFVIRALERGIFWMKNHPQGIDGLSEIEEGLKQLGGTPAEVAASPEPRKLLRKPKPVVKPTADWKRLATKLGHEAEVERRQREYDQYRIDLEEYKRAVKLRRKERKDQF